IGTDKTGSVALSNDNAGVAIAQGANNNTIGGTSDGARNVISGNATDGVQITDNGSTDNLVEGNYIGTDANGNGLIPGTVAWYKAEGNANDSVSGLNGTVNGGLSFDPGEVGQAFTILDVSDFVTVPDSPSIDLTNGFTLEAWVKLTPLGPFPFYRTIFDK